MASFDRVVYLVPALKSSALISITTQAHTQASRSLSVDLGVLTGLASDPEKQLEMSFCKIVSTKKGLKDTPTVFPPRAMSLKNKCLDSYCSEN